MRIVVADDMRPCRLFAVRILSRIGEVVGQAINGKEAIEMCARLRPDLVLLDCQMPIVTGQEAARTIIAAGTAKYVITATAVRQAVVLDALAKLGAHNVAKPYYEEQLLREVREIVDAGKAETQ
jgi:two-component system, response regulator PdtaR